MRGGTPTLASALGLTVLISPRPPSAARLILFRPPPARHSPSILHPATSMATLSPLTRRLQHSLRPTSCWPQPPPHASTSTAHLRFASSTPAAPAPPAPPSASPAQSTEQPVREHHGSVSGRHGSVHPRDRLRFARAPGEVGEAEEEDGGESTPTVVQGGGDRHGSNLNGWKSLLNGDHTVTEPRREGDAQPDEFQLVTSSDPNQHHNHGLPHPSSQPFPLPRVPFSTQQFVNSLEQADLPRPQANQIMSATLSLLLSRELRARQELLSRQDLDNQAYLFTAALAELKTGSEVKARQDNAMLGSMKSGLERETEVLGQRVKEDVQRLHSDIQVSQESGGRGEVKIRD